jgi:hypothetical protein
MSGRRVTSTNERSVRRKEARDSIDVHMFAAAERSGSFRSPDTDRYREIARLFDRDELFAAAGAARRIRDDTLARKIEAVWQRS